MTEIRIDNTGNGTWWLYNGNSAWKDYVCEDFDDNIVLFGNRDMNETKEAQWYQKAKEVLDNIDYYDEFPEDFSAETNAKLKDLYDSCRCTDDIMLDVIRLLNPSETFVTGTIRGYCQGDWQYYIAKENVNVDNLEAFYFGSVADVTVTTNEETFGDVITHDELWKAKKDGLRSYLRKRYEIPDNEQLHVFIAEQMASVPKWEEM